MHSRNKLVKAQTRSHLRAARPWWSSRKRPSDRAATESSRKASKLLKARQPQPDLGIKRRRLKSEKETMSWQSNKSTWRAEDKRKSEERALKERFKMVSNGQKRKLIALDPSTKSGLAEQFESRL